MGISEETRLQLASRLEALLPHLDERQRRLAIGAEARTVGHGGIRAVAQVAGVSEATVSKGVAELESGQDPLGRVRRAGGGRRRQADVDPGLLPALLALVEPDVRGDPMSPLRWTTKSTRRLAAELTKRGHRVSADTVAALLKEEGFSLQANAKTLEGKQHPDRDAQFRYLNEQVRGHQDAGQPVISVDTKKKELVGEFKNSGREWHPGGQPVRVSVHDFADPSLGKAVPYGIYDLAANAGWVNVGCDHDTAAFAVTSIRRWWHGQGKSTYPLATRLLITADAGGSNGYRTRAWKIELATLAAETGLTITVCHLPPSTSKWNKIEHRLFSHITMNWRGRPLTSHEVVVQSIAATTSRSGLRVHAELDTGTYPTGVRIGNADMAALPLTRHTFHGDWNYVLHPALVGTPPSDEPLSSDGLAPPSESSDGLAPPSEWNQSRLSDPALTGMSRQQLAALTAALAALHEAQAGNGLGRPPRLSFDDQVLVTVLHLRLNLPAEPLAVMLGSSRSAVHRTFHKIRELLDQHKIAVAPATMPPAAMDALRDHVIAQGSDLNSKIKPAC